MQSKKIVAAKMRRSWPVAAQYKPSEESIQLWMKNRKGKWFHVRNLAPQESERELEAWKENNAEWEFKLAEKPHRSSSEPVLDESGKGYGHPHLKWDHSSNT